MLFTPGKPSSILEHANLCWRQLVNPSSRPLPFVNPARVPGSDHSHVGRRKSRHEEIVGRRPCCHGVWDWHTGVPGRRGCSSPGCGPAGGSGRPGVCRWLLRPSGLRLPPKLGFQAQGTLPFVQHLLSTGVPHALQHLQHLQHLRRSVLSHHAAGSSASPQVLQPVRLPGALRSVRLFVPWQAQGPVPSRLRIVLQHLLSLAPAQFPDSAATSGDPRARNFGHGDFSLMLPHAFFQFP